MGGQLRFRAGHLQATRMVHLHLQNANAVSKFGVLRGRHSIASTGRPAAEQYLLRLVIYFVQRASPTVITRSTSAFFPVKRLPDKFRI